MASSINKTLLGAGAILLLMASCKREITGVTYLGGTTPALTSSASDSIQLLPNDSSNTAVTFTWTNPNYQFSDGANTQNVSYNLEFDSAGKNFSSANMQTVSLVNSLSTSFTVTAFNALVANGLNLTFGKTQTIQVRVVSFIANGDAGAVAINSNALSYSVTPFAPPPKITPPASGVLYIVGSAVADNWANPIPAGDVAGETFTQVSPTEYTLTTNLVGSGEYKLISVNGSWTNQWSVATNDTYPDGGPFVFNGNNCIAPAKTGTYIIDVNFQTGTFSVTAQ